MVLPGEEDVDICVACFLLLERQVCLVAPELEGPSDGVSGALSGEVSREVEQSGIGVGVLFREGRLGWKGGEVEKPFVKKIIK